jgi:hypothetical protein
MIKNESGSTASMKAFRGLFIVFLMVSALAAKGVAQSAPSSAESRPLILTGAIPLPGVHGRIDISASMGRATSSSRR